MEGGTLLLHETIRSVSDENTAVRVRSGPGKSLPAAGTYFSVEERGLYPRPEGRGYKAHRINGDWSFHVFPSDSFLLKSITYFASADEK